MNAATTVRKAAAAGIRLKLAGDRLVLSAASRPDDELVEAIRSEKPQIVGYLRGLAAWTEDDWQALFDERAAIMEFDGGLSRREAEDNARAEIEVLRRLIPEPPHD